MQPTWEIRSGCFLYITKLRSPKQNITDNVCGANSGTTVLSDWLRELKRGRETGREGIRKGERETGKGSTMREGGEKRKRQRQREVR